MAPKQSSAHQDVHREFVNDPLYQAVIRLYLEDAIKPMLNGGATEFSSSILAKSVIERLGREGLLDACKSMIKKIAKGKPQNWSQINLGNILGVELLKIMTTDHNWSVADDPNSQGKLYRRP